MTTAWQPLGTPKPTELGDARAHAHWAAQVIAAAGETHCAHAPDTSHTAMVWDAPNEALVGHVLDGDATETRLGLRISSLTLLVLQAKRGPRPVAECALAGSSLAEAYAWAEQQLREATRGALDAPLRHPGFDLPEHPLGRSRKQVARFAVDASGLAELARWYANASAELARRHESDATTPVLCWPHHFDIACLIELERDGNGQATRSVGFGLSPGDEFFPEPYWYVNHWPGPDDDAPTLPPLAAGEWYTEGWTGAVLRARDLVAERDAAAQQRLLRTFLDDAIAANRSLA